MPSAILYEVGDTLALIRLRPSAFIANPLPFPSTAHPASTTLPIRTARDGRTRIIDVSHARTS